MNSEEDIECAICLDTANQNNRIKLNECGHIFHSYCFKLWYLKKDECPICRANIKYHFICTLTNNYISYFNKKYIIKIDTEELLIYNILKENEESKQKKISKYIKLMFGQDIDQKSMIYTDVFLDLKKNYVRGDIIKKIDYRHIKNIKKNNNIIRIELYNGLVENIYCNNVFKLNLANALIDKVKLFYKKLGTYSQQNNNQTNTQPNAIIQINTINQTNTNHNQNVNTNTSQV
tara:strand:+ start:223 stop:921 length:699 start_codon:yes stop_codon:yes gene_type:complete